MILGVGLLLATLVAPAAAQADGDPASDILPDADVYYPYSPSVSNSETKRLNALLAEAAKKKVHMKVALIATTQDMGVVVALFGKPVQYAPFLAQELAFAFKGPLIVVMPQGVAIVGGTAKGMAAAKAAGPKAVSVTTTADPLAQAAKKMLKAYAATSGIKLTGSTQSPSKKGLSTLVTSILIGSLVFILLAVAAIFASRASGGSEPPKPESDAS